MVVMEPQSIPNVEQQAYGRIRRLSQKNPRTFTYCLVWSVSEIETKVFRRQNVRKHLGKSSDANNSDDVAINQAQDSASNPWDDMA